MNHTFLEIIHYLKTHKKGPKDHLLKIRDEIIFIINKENDFELKKLLIYYADHQMIQIYDELWLDYLLEKLMLQTTWGGNDFYVQIKKHLKNRNYNYVKYTLHLMQAGFNTLNPQENKEVYKKYHKLIHLENAIQDTYSYYQPHRPQNLTQNWFLLLYIPLLAILILNLMEVIMFIPIHNILRGF